MKAVSVVSELKRRNVVKVAIAYAAISWMLIQLVKTVEAPPWPAAQIPFRRFRFEGGLAGSAVEPFLRHVSWIGIEASFSYHRFK